MPKTEPLPKWMTRRYAQLWRLVKEKDFTLDEAVKVLKEDKKIILVLFSNWRKNGWLQVDFDTEDARRRVYKLKDPATIMEAMSDVNKRSIS